MLKEIQASFECDECGKPFSVEMDPARKVPPEWSLFDEAVDAVRGSVGYRGPTTRDGLGGCSAVVDGRHLCGECERDFLVCDACKKGVKAPFAPGDRCVCGGTFE